MIKIHEPGVRVMVVNDNYNNISVISCHGGQFYWLWLRKPEYPEKTPNLPQATDINDQEHYHIKINQMIFCVGWGLSERLCSVWKRGSVRR